MTVKERIVEEIERLSEPVDEDLLDQIRFVTAKYHASRCETMLMSEDVLARDWLDPAEDEAWNHL